MTEKVIWLNPGQEVEYCWHCHSKNISISEDGRHASCNGCGKGTIVKHRKPTPKPRARAMSSDEFREKMKAVERR